MCIFGVPRSDICKRPWDRNTTKMQMRKHSFGAPRIWNNTALLSMKGRNLVLHPSERCLYLSTRKATRDDDRFECFQLNIEKNVVRTESWDFLWDTINEKATCLKFPKRESSVSLQAFPVWFVEVTDMWSSLSILVLSMSATKTASTESNPLLLRNRDVHKAATHAILQWPAALSMISASGLGVNFWQARQENPVVNFSKQNRVFRFLKMDEVIILCPSRTLELFHVGESVCTRTRLGPRGQTGPAKEVSWSSLHTEMHPPNLFLCH